MIRLWATFLLFAIGIHFSIISWRALSGKERWSLTKTFAYSIIVSLLAVMVMTLIVIVF
jgi:hypothetical protein